MSIATQQSAPSLGHLVGKRVVVVGGSSGIGYAVAQAALEHGAVVIIASSNQSKIEAAVIRLLNANSAFHGSVSGLRLDAKDVTSIGGFWDAVGKFDHLVWTAGDTIHSNFMDADLEAERAFFDVRFWAPILSVKYAYKNGLFNPGASVTLSGGVISRKPRKGWAIGTAGAGAIETLASGLAVELAPIRVNTIAPGAVETEMWDGGGPEMKAHLQKVSAERSLVKHTAQPDELAEAYLFAMKCTNLTGQTICVEGGSLLA